LKSNRFLTCRILSQRVFHQSIFTGHTPLTKTHPGRESVKNAPKKITEVLS
jgi:hypothetical protein